MPKFVNELRNNDKVLLEGDSTGGFQYPTFTRTNTSYYAYTNALSDLSLGEGFSTKSQLNWDFVIYQADNTFNIIKNVNNVWTYDSAGNGLNDRDYGVGVALTSFQTTDTGLLSFNMTFQCTSLGTIHSYNKGPIGNFMSLYCTNNIIPSNDSNYYKATDLTSTNLTSLTGAANFTDYQKYIKQLKYNNDAGLTQIANEFAYNYFNNQCTLLKKVSLYDSIVGADRYFTLSWSGYVKTDTIFYIVVRARSGCALFNDIKNIGGNDVFYYTITS